MAARKKKKPSALVEMVKAIAEMTRQSNIGVGLVYRNAYDFVDQHGREYAPPTEEDPRYEMGEPRACYHNSATATLGNPELRYVEGYAWTKNTEGLPIHHAWNLDEDGNVVDLTWGGEGIAYLGVEFPVETWGPAFVEGSGSVLDDWKRGFPIYRERWTGLDIDSEAP